MADEDIRGYLLPLKKTPEGIRPAVPGVLRDAYNSASIFGRAARGEPVSNAEAVNTAISLAGGGYASPKPTGAMGMGGGKVVDLAAKRAIANATKVDTLRKDIRAAYADYNRWNNLQDVSKKLLRLEYRDITPDVVKKLETLSANEGAMLVGGKDNLAQLQQRLGQWRSLKDNAREAYDRFVKLGEELSRHIRKPE